MIIALFILILIFLAYMFYMIAKDYRSMKKLSDKYEINLNERTR